MSSVLLVEDNPGDARLLQISLRPDFTVRHVERLADALVAEPADVVLLDLSLPDSQGLDTFRRFHAACPEAAVIVLTGLADDAAAMEAVRDGAQDYIVKGRVDADGLVRAIRYAIERNRLGARLRELDRVRSLFLSVVSHDLKSPAAAILAGVDMLLGERLGPLNPRQRRALELARSSAQRQTRLVEDLLDLAVIEAGRMSLAPRDVDLAVTVRAAVDELRPLAAERSLELACEADRPLVVRADPDRIAQAVTNLIGNAIKFAAKRVDVRLYADAGGARIDVDDDGPGIPDELLGQIFERFVRGDSSSAGAGLGLSIVRGIAEAHGGNVRVTNRADGGSRFMITLPMR